MSATLPPNPGHPFHRASYWLDHRKLLLSDGGPVAAVTGEQVAEEIAELLRANGFDPAGATSLRDAIQYYGDAYASSFGLPSPLALAIFYDGVAHALAFTGKLEADPPPYEEKKSHVH